MDGLGLDDMLLDFPSSQDLLDAPGESDGEDQNADILDDGNDSHEQSPPWPLGSSPPGSPNRLVDDIANLDDTKEIRENLEPRHPTCPNRDSVIDRIENILEEIVDALIDGKKPLSVTLRTRAGTSGRTFNSWSGITTTPTDLKTKQLTFPGSTPREAWRFTVFVRILEFVHAALVNNVVVSKRDIYYRHPDLFVKQAVVDRYVDDLACTLGVSRFLLNVTAAAKGLVAGNFSIQRPDGDVFNGLSDAEGLLVPRLLPEDILDLSKIGWILVIEKEATFRSLLSSSEWGTLGSDGIVLTAKGYPDLSSRTFLGRLTSNSPNVPLYALVDYDPDGIAIMSTYKYGSYALAHENQCPGEASHEGGSLNLPHLQWLGIKSHQLHAVADTSPTSDAPSTMKLTARDRRKARQMLSWQTCSERSPETEWRRALQVMLLLNTKAEMQILEDLSGGVSGWLKAALGTGGSEAGGGCGRQQDGITGLRDLGSDDGSQL